MEYEQPWNMGKILLENCVDTTGTMHPKKLLSFKFCEKHSWICSYVKVFINISRKNYA